MKYCLMLLAGVLLASALMAGEYDPILREDGGKWRVAYVESGYYYDYQQNLGDLLLGLMNRGWIEPMELPEPGFDEEPLSYWFWVCDNLHSDYLEFLRDDCWSYRYESERRASLTPVIIQCLNSGDIDLLLSLGTWAGQEMATNDHHVPTFVISVSDPLRAGIIESPENSGFDHVTTHLDPERYITQLRMFHNIFRFQRLGVVYEDTPAGRSYAALDDIRAVAQERGFEVVEAQSLSDGPDAEKLYEDLLACYTDLAPRVDAMYLTAHSAHVDRWLPSLTAPFDEHEVPTFSQAGEEEVEHGVLLSLSTEDHAIVMQFMADKIVQVLHGAKPGDLPQVIRTPAKLAINLDVAQRIGWDPPLEILKMCDRVFSTTPEGEAP